MQDTTEPAFGPVVGLGAFRSDHTPSSERRRKSLINQLLVTACGIIVIAGGAGWIVYTSIRNPNGDASFAFVLVCFGALIVPLGLMGLLGLWRHWQVGAALYEKGLAYKDRSGIRQLTWQDVEAVWQNVTKHYRNGVHVRTTHTYTIQTRDNKRLVLDDNLINVEQLGNEVIRGTAAELAPRYMQALLSGQQLKFGPLAISQQGIAAGNKRLKWAEIKGIKIQKGIISVKKNRGWFNWVKATVPQIPNFMVFYELVRRFVNVE